MRPVFLAGGSNSAKKSQTVSCDSKLHGNRLVSRLAAESTGICVDDVFGSNACFLFFFANFLSRLKSIFKRDIFFYPLYSFFAFRT